MVQKSGTKILKRTGRLASPVHLKKGDDFYFVNDANLVGDNTQVQFMVEKRLRQLI